MKQIRSGEQDNGLAPGEFKRLIIWGITLSVITLSMLGTGIYFLYDASYDQQAQQLQDAVANKAALIKSVARFDRQNLPDTSVFENQAGQGPGAATFRQINESFSSSAGLGQTGEFVLGTREGDEIVILAHQRAGKPKSHTHRYPFDGDGVAEPMRAALNGQFGLVRGRDFHGVAVLAAVKPLPGVDWGLVAKKNRSEIRAPYIRSAGFTGAGALILIILAGYFFRRSLTPIIESLRSSRAHYDRLIRAAGQGILYMDSQDRVRIANHQARELLQLSEQVEGMPLVDALTGNLKAVAEEKLVAQREGQSLEFEADGEVNGERRYLKVFTTPFFRNNGDYEGALALFSDVTEAREAQLALERERQLLSSVLEMLPVAIWVTDARGRMLMRNPASRLIWDTEDSEANHDVRTAGSGVRAWWADSGEPVQSGHWGVERALDQGESSSDDLVDIETTDESVRTLRLSAVPMLDEDQGIRGAIAVGEDITHRRHMERLMRRNEQLLERVVENLPEGLAISDDRGTYIMSNDSDEAIWGFDRLGQSPSAFPGVAYRDRDESPVAEQDWPIHRVLRTGESIEGDLFEVIRRSDGDRRWLSCSAAPVFDNNDAIWGVVEMVQDVTRQRRQNAEMRMLSDAVRHAAEAILVLDAQGRVEFCNPAFSDVTGYKLDDVLGQRPVEFLQHDAHALTSFDRMRALGEAGESGREVIPNRDKKGTLFQWDCTLSPVFNNDNRLVNYVVNATDLSEQTRMHEALYHATRYDALTGLPNSDCLREYLEQAVAAAAKDIHVAAVVKIDIVGFSLINEKHGHALGDQVLLRVSQRVAEVVGNEDIIGRVGPDAFGVLLKSTFAEEGVAAMVDKIARVFEEPLTVDGVEVPCKVNMGVALAPADGIDAETLIQHVNVALSHARQEDVGVRFYAPKLGQQARRRLTLEVALKQAIEQEQFELHFQPQFNLSTGGVRGLETLIRWEHPEMGPISPAEFIPLAEKTGLITKLSPWVLRHSLRQRAAWRRDGLEPGRIAVNLSARDFDDPKLAQRIRRLLEETGEPADGLELEITETMLMEKGDSQLQLLKELSEMGITISVDDFGTGYSSLAYLSVLPISLLKIDRSFINSVNYETDTNAAIIRSIIAMAQSLGLDVVAEGVETQWQLDFLRKLNCDMAQGFLLARPSGSVTVTEMLKRDHFLTA